jgi:virginiamycin A acetyltransferase
VRHLAKAAFNACFLLLALVPALLTAFGRQRTMFSLFAQTFALVPGVVGEYARKAYYRLTLASSSMQTCISFGTFFSNRDAVIEPGVFIGAYCIIGRVRIGAHTLLASNVHVLSGRRQHVRDAHGGISGAEEGTFTPVSIGANCWIGESAVVMADVGEGSTVGAGSVVTKPVPAGVVAVGNPARVLQPK